MAVFTTSLKGRQVDLCVGRSSLTSQDRALASTVYRCLGVFESSVRKCSMTIVVVATGKGSKMKFLFAMALTLATIAPASSQTIIRDSQGRITTTVTTDSNGQQTFRDGRGQLTGTASPPDSNGTTTFRDGSGHMTGTAQERRR